MTGNLNNLGNGNIFQILQQFSEFKRSFQGDPQQEIAELQQIISGLNLAASQSAQNAYLISQLKT